MALIKRFLSSTVLRANTMVLRDLPSTPAPIRSIGVQESSELKALRAKERNSWKDLSGDEKIARKCGFF